MAGQKLGPPYSKEFLARRSPEELRALNRAARARTPDKSLDALGEAFDAPGKGGKR